jgi:hypothetical protein
MEKPTGSVTGIPAFGMHRSDRLMDIFDRPYGLHMETCIPSQIELLAKVRVIPTTPGIHTN